LRRAVQRFIEDPLSEQLLRGTFSAGDHIVADVDPEGQVVFHKGDPLPTDEEEAVAKN
jgi:ATP-dependent Clp protease ATP-binding subunit ClpC